MELEPIFLPIACAMRAQQIGADYVLKHPWERLERFGCEPADKPRSADL